MSNAQRANDQSQVGATIEETLKAVGNDTVAPPNTTPKRLTLPPIDRKTAAAVAVIAGALMVIVLVASSTPAPGNFLAHPPTPLPTFVSNNPSFIQPTLKSTETPTQTVQPTATEAPTETPTALPTVVVPTSPPPPPAPEPTQCIRTRFGETCGVNLDPTTVAIEQATQSALHSQQWLATATAQAEQN